MVRVELQKFIYQYFMEYTMVNGLPTSKYGTALVRKCKLPWCYNVIHFYERGTRIEKIDSQLNQRFCCDDCEQEYKDYMYIREYERRLKSGKNSYQTRKEKYKNNAVFREKVKSKNRKYYQDNKRKVLARVRIKRSQLKKQKLYDNKSINNSSTRL